MSYCKLVHDNLFAYAEKELPSALMEQIDQHVSECAECARIVSEFKSVMAFIDEQKSIGPRPFAETRILQGIESRLEKRQKSSTPVFARILQPVLISIGLLAALAIGYLIGSDISHTHSQYSQNTEMIQAERSDLNVPDFMTDDLFHFTE